MHQIKCPLDFLFDIKTVKLILTQKRVGLPHMVYNDTQF